MAKKHHSVAIANTGSSHAVIIYDFPRLHASNSDVKGGESIEYDTYFLEMPVVITL